jgi:hypothetical protein
MRPTERKISACSGAGYTLRVSFQRQHWFKTEGYDVYATLYDESKNGHIVARFVVDDVNIPLDVERRFSKVKWDGSMKAFADAQGYAFLSVEGNTFTVFHRTRSGR